MGEDSDLEKRLNVSTELDAEETSGYQRPSLMSVLSASYYKWKNERRKIKYNDKKIVELLKLSVKDTLADTGRQVFLKRKNGNRPTHEQIAEMFYDNFIFRISPQGKPYPSTEKHVGINADNFRYLTENQLTKKVIDHILTEISQAFICAVYEDSVGRLTLEKRYSGPEKTSILPLKGFEIAGLVISGLINYSDKIKTIKIANKTEMDYLGAFLRAGKKLSVLPSTGDHFGYRSEEGSNLYARKLRDMNKPKSLGRLLIDSFGSNLKSITQLIEVGFGASIAAMTTYSALLLENVVKPLSNSQLMRLGINQEEFYQTFFYMQRYGLPLAALVVGTAAIGLYTLGYGIKDFISAYRAQKASFPIQKANDKAIETVNDEINPVAMEKTVSPMPVLSKK